MCYFLSLRQKKNLRLFPKSMVHFYRVSCYIRKDMTSGTISTKYKPCFTSNINIYIYISYMHIWWQIEQLCNLYEIKNILIICWVCQKSLFLFCFLFDQLWKNARTLDALSICLYRGYKLVIVHSETGCALMCQSRQYNVTMKIKSYLTTNQLKIWP